MKYLFNLYDDPTERPNSNVNFDYALFGFWLYAETIVMKIDFSLYLDNLKAKFCVKIQRHGRWLQYVNSWVYYYFQVVLPMESYRSLSSIKFAIFQMLHTYKSSSKMTKVLIHFLKSPCEE